MLKTRIIPCLLLKKSGLVKTVKFKNPTYIGDPINVVKIFNDKEVDELIFLDISVTPEGNKPNFDLISDITSEAFMPFGYGGGIKELSDIEKLFKIGVEKVVLNSVIYNTPTIVSQAIRMFGSQSIVASIDYKSNFLGNNEVWIECGTKNTKINPVNYARKLEELGVGEILLNSIDRDGTYQGYDLTTIKKATENLKIPLIACGGASSIEDFGRAINEGASAVSAGSMFVFQGIHKAVLITYPKYKELEKLLNKKD